MHLVRKRKPFFRFIFYFKSLVLQSDYYFLLFVCVLICIRPWERCTQTYKIYDYTDDLCISGKKVNMFMCLWWFRCNIWIERLQATVKGSIFHTICIWCFYLWLFLHHFNIIFPYFDAFIVDHLNLSPHVT